MTTEQQGPILRVHFWGGICFIEGGDWRTDWRILKIFLPRFRIQNEILIDFRILQLQWIADSSIFWAWILDFACK